MTLMDLKALRCLSTSAGSDWFGSMSLRVPNLPCVECRDLAEVEGATGSAPRRDAVSQCYDLICIDCEVVRRDVGQTGHSGRYFYDDNAVYDFLQKHAGHRIRLFSELKFNEEIETKWAHDDYVDPLAANGHE